MANVILEVWESNSDQTNDYPLLIRFIYGFSVLTFYIPKDNSIKSSPIPFAYLKNVPKGIGIEGKNWIINQEERIVPENLEYTFRYSSKLE